MNESERKPKDRRVFVTTTATIFLLAFPYIEIPISITFLAPITAELLAYVVFILWAMYRSKSASKRKLGATSELVSSIGSNIDRLKSDIASTDSGPIKDMLQKKLVDLYKERIDEESKQREDMRANIKKYEKEEKDCIAEHDSLKEDAMKIASERAIRIARKQASKQS